MDGGGRRTLTCNILDWRVTMNRSSKNPIQTTLPLAGAALVLSAATLLGGCVVQERVVAPPPRVYAPPPPPPPPPPAYYAEPAADVEVRATEAPPPLPDYEQPPCPEEGYLWTPGYWAWGGGGYYWVPGTWVQPPRVGVLWTPGYWGFVGGAYVFHAGYWGPHVGFYGGVNYGYGYVGVGFVGGRWSGNSFAYNRTVNNVNVTNIHNTYNETVINNVTVNKVSYNGGAGGIAAAPTVQERAAEHEQHVPPTPMQHQHVQEAARNPALAAKTNGGHPAIAATPKPAAFTAPGVVGAHGATMTPRMAAQGVTAQGAGAATPHMAGQGAATPPLARTPEAARANNNVAGGLPPGAQPTVTHVPPNTPAHPQGAAAKPPAPKAQGQRSNPPKNDKHEHEPEGRNK
jgi:hypothetical protein